VGLSWNCAALLPGQTSLAFSLLAQATERQEACAFVDVSDSLDPVSLAAESRTIAFDGPPALSAGGPEFESRRPDQKYLACFLLLIESAVHLHPTCGILADRRSGFASHLLSKSSLHDEFSKT
jgi:hypothetical protein